MSEKILMPLAEQTEPELSREYKINLWGGTPGQVGWLASIATADILKGIAIADAAMIIISHQATKISRKISPEDRSRDIAIADTTVVTISHQSADIL